MIDDICAVIEGEKIAMHAMKLSNDTCKLLSGRNVNYELAAHREILYIRRKLLVLEARLEKMKSRPFQASRHILSQGGEG